RCPSTFNEKGDPAVVSDAQYPSAPLPHEPLTVRSNESIPEACVAVAGSANGTNSSASAAVTTRRRPPLAIGPKPMEEVTLGASPEMTIFRTGTRMLAAVRRAAIPLLLLLGLVSCGTSAS